jgi:hypothetical protein
MDFMPGRPKERANNKSYYPVNDVGWRLKDYIGAKDIELIDFIDCKTNQGKYFDSGFQSDEFQRNGVCLAAHFGRGSNLGGKAKRKKFKKIGEQLELWKIIAKSLTRNK